MPVDDSLTVRLGFDIWNRDLSNFPIHQNGQGVISNPYQNFAISLDPC